ncbi:MAG: hypothetical protein LUH05_10110 [Candidatus Gastranaerophilales bacterium]|nr:hypothetical protein [Candidatus Gastranaerophilales bacterium]
MPQPFSQNNHQLKKRISVLVFLKGTTAPLVLYVENPLEFYEELSQILKLNSPAVRLIEKNTLGPVKKVCIQSTQICAIAIQEEQYM